MPDRPAGGRTREAPGTESENVRHTSPPESRRRPADRPGFRPSSRRERRLPGRGRRSRNLVLAVLVIGATLGAAVAVPGSAAATGGVEPAVISVTETGGTIELAFNTAVEKNETTPGFGEDTPLDAATIEVYVRRAGSPDYDVFTDSAVRGTRRGGGIVVRPGGRSGTSGTGDARYLVRIPALGDLDPADDVKINFTRPVDNADEEPPGRYAATIGNVTVPTTATAIEEAGPGDADTTHGTRESAAQVYRGERIAVEANTANTGVFVRNVEGGVVLDGSTGPNSRTITLDSRRFRSGVTYKIGFGGSEDGKFFNVSSLDLRATLRQDGRRFASDERVGLDVEASAVRGNAPIVVATGVGRPPIHRERLDGRAEFARRYDAGTNRSGAIAAGRYRVTVTDVRTGVTAVAGTYRVERFPAAESARFPEGVVTEDRGDVVEIPIRLENSEDGARVTLSIGDADDANYVTNLTVSDENGDGKVTVEWNTFNAGVNDLHRVFNVTGPDTIETWGWERGPFVDELRNGTGGYDPGLDGGPPRYPADTVSKNYTLAKNLTVDATTYEMRVVANGGDNPPVVDNFTHVEADDVGTVSLGDNGVEASELLVTSPQNAGELDTEWISDNLDRNADPVDGNLTESGIFAGEELLVHRVRARGIEGIIRNRTTFHTADGVSPDPGTAFLNETRQSIRYRDRRYVQADRDGDGVVDDPGELSATLTPSWTVGYNETGAGFNRDPRRLTVNESTIDFVPDYGNDTYYLVVDLDSVGSGKLVDGRTWWANVSIDGQESPSDRSGGGGHVSEVWEYQDPVATLRTGVDGRVAVRAAGEQVLRGETNVAPGTLLEVRTIGEGSRFVGTSIARVTARRTFAATVDFFANASQGTKFTTLVRRDTERISDEYEGRVRAAPRASVSVENQTVGPTRGAVVVDRAWLSNGGFVAVRFGHAGGPVVGASRYLGPGAHSDVRIALDRDLPHEATLVAVAHLDDDADNRFEFPDADEPYTRRGAAVADSASVTVASGTATPTSATPTAAGTATPTTTSTPGSGTMRTRTRTPRPGSLTPPTTVRESGAGLGVGVATVGLAAAALVAVALFVVSRRAGRDERE